MSEKYKFEDLYKDYNRYVLRVCTRIVGSVLAEDMTQETFIRVFKGLEGFKGKANIKTWIYRIAINECLVYRRNERREKRYGKAVPIEEMVNHPKILPVPIVTKLTVMEEINSLSPGYRLYFILHGIEGYEHQEIAKVLDSCVGTSKSQYHRARTILRKSFGMREMKTI